MNASDISAKGPVNGIGEMERGGSYIKINVADQEFKISEGAAEVLVNEINGILEIKKEFSERCPDCGDRVPYFSYHLDVDCMNGERP